ncbi:hypothetical protein ACMFMG_001141 [Clarireedia jacksonii]
MKCSLIKLLVSVPLISAIDFPGLPSCASSCLSSAITAGTHCNIEDPRCQCQAASQSAIQTTAIPCLLTACPQSALQAAVSAGGQLCAAFSARLTSGSSSTSGSSTSTSASAATSSAAHVSTANRTTSAAKSTSARLSTAGTNAAKSTSTGTTSISGGGRGNSSVAVGTPKSSITVGVGTSTASPSQASGNSAQAVGAGMGGLVVVLAGMVIAL